MSAANVKFDSLDSLDAEPGQEQTFSFDCPKHNRRCFGLIIHGRTDLKHDPKGQNGGIAQWHWDGNRDAPTFTPSIDCGKCWHGYIERGRCVDTAKKDEPDIRTG
jgi:hypothetical protein